MVVKKKFHRNKRLQINSDFEKLLHYNGIHSTSDLWDLESEPVKNAVKTRGTSRAFLKDPNGGSKIEVYIKRYLKPSFKDRIKCALSFKPVFLTGAMHEWDAINRFHQLGLKTMTPIAAGSLGSKTCNMTLGITDYVRASDLFKCELQNDPKRQRRIIIKIADLLGRMHAAGLAHQDFYLVHLFVKPKENDEIYLIDLQRTLMQKKLSKRWKIKDLAQIHFSMGPRVTKEGIKLFREHYTGRSPTDSTLWSAVETKAKRIQKHTEKKGL